MSVTAADRARAVALLRKIDLSLDGGEQLQHIHEALAAARAEGWDDGFGAGEQAILDTGGTAPIHIAYNRGLEKGQARVAALEADFEERMKAALLVNEARLDEIGELKAALRDAIACAESGYVPKKKILADWKALAPCDGGT